MAPESENRPEDQPFKNPTGAPEPDGGEPKSFGAEASRPSDVEVAHRPNEGSSVRSGEGEPSTTQEYGQGGSGRDRRLDYGAASGSATANAGDGTGDLTAGAALADALPPDAVAERADIAADDAGASAFAQAAGEARTGRLDDDESNPTTEGSGAMPGASQGRDVDPGAG